MPGRIFLKLGYRHCGITATDTRVEPGPASRRLRAACCSRGPLANTFGVADLGYRDARDDQRNGGRSPRNALGRSPDVRGKWQNARGEARNAAGECPNVGAKSPDAHGARQNRVDELLNAPRELHNWRRDKPDAHGEPRYTCGG